MKRTILANQTRLVTACTLAVMISAIIACPGHAQAPGAVKVGIPVFLSGAAVASFGEPSRNAAELVVDAINAGTLPSPYNTKGLGGAPIEAKIVDEAGSANVVVTEFRNLIERDGMNVIVGYVSSASCLAVAPIAEQLKTLTIIYACGTSRLFEGTPYEYVFRVSPHTSSDNIAAARYVLRKFPGLESYSGINQNYSWGQDAWADFAGAMKALSPSTKAQEALFPKLFSGEYGAEISTLLIAKSKVVHSSFWDGDLESFVVQSSARKLPQISTLVLTVGEQIIYRNAEKMPDGTIIGARGQNGILASDNELNRWFAEAYVKRFGAPPNFPSYHMYQSLLGLKAAWDKAAAENGGARPSAAQVASKLKYLEFPTASGLIKMALGNGHQGIEDMPFGTYKYNREKGRPELVDVVNYSAECVNPPDGTATTAWIAQGMPGAKCH
jgi:branched-chain amino acid transport system substrate-binding protein